MLSSEDYARLLEYLMYSSFCLTLCCHLKTTLHSLTPQCIHHSVYYIRDLRRICRYLPLSFAKTIATVLVSCRLDYCNSLYHSIVLRDIMKLQCVQNCLSWVVTKSLCFSHSVPLIKSLHRLPIQHRIILKICTITYQGNRHIYITCSLPQERLGSVNHLLHISILFPEIAELRQTLEGELSQLLHLLCGTHYLSVLSHVKIYLHFDLAYPP